MAETAVIVHADKTVMRITGLRVQGLDTRALEQLLAERLATAVRVIGVTGEAVEMDVYGAPDEAVLRDEAGILRAVSLCEGITATEVAHMALSERILPVDAADIPEKTPCARERWMRYEHLHHPDRG